MDAIGFRHDHDSGIVKQFFIRAPNNSVLSELNQNEIAKAISYLENGVSIFSITLGVFHDAVYIGPYTLLTDGHWIWPSHFLYYLRNGCLDQLTESFLNYLKKRNFKFKKLTIKDKEKALFFLQGNLLDR